MTHKALHRSALSRRRFLAQALGCLPLEVLGAEAQGASEGESYFDESRPVVNRPEDLSADIVVVGGGGAGLAAAARAGLMPRDIILSANGKTVKTVGDLRRAVSGADKVALLVQRQDSRIFIAVDLK